MIIKERLNPFVSKELRQRGKLSTEETASKGLKQDFDPRTCVSQLSAPSPWSWAFKD